MSACDLKEMKALAYEKFLERAKTPEKWEKAWFYYSNCPLNPHHFISESNATKEQKRP